MSATAGLRRPRLSQGRRGEPACAVRGSFSIDVIDKVVRSRALALPSAREGADALRKGAASRVKRPYEIEFGELDVGKELARGAFGAVHRAIWRGTVVAVKVQLSKTLADKQLHECVAEGARSSQARHPLRRPHDAPVSSRCHPPPSLTSCRQGAGLGYTVARLDGDHHVTGLYAPEKIHRGNRPFTVLSRGHVGDGGEVAGCGRRRKARAQGAAA